VKIYTRTGDDGRTDLFGGERVSKTSARVNAYGTVDELNAALGIAASQTSDPELGRRIADVQRRLLDLGADIATPNDAAAASHITRADDTWTADLESDIDTMTAYLEPLADFILPGGDPAASSLHLARTICRRAERMVLEALESGTELNPAAPVYLNRLGDWLFTLARLANVVAGVPDRLWKDLPATDEPRDG
jgi:cob(I)alamin adenosyltransferase